MFRIAPYSHGSKSANVLKEALGALFLKKVGSDYTYKKGDVVINWGAPYGPKGMNCLNCDNNIVRDKVVFFKTALAAGLQPVIPPVAFNKDDAAKLKFPVFCRTEVDGSDGSGIVVATKTSELVPAKLYTSYIKQTQEYRVHVGKVDGKAVIIHVQRKAKLNASTDKTTMIRTGSHGYILAHHNFTAPEVVFDVAKKVFMACKLDFGGCDVVYDGETNSAYVLEINTAPELSGPSVEKYANFFKQFHEETEAAAVEAKPEGSGTVAQEVVGEAMGGVHAGVGAKQPSVLVGSDQPVLGAAAKLGMATQLSGGDTAGLMKQLELSIEAKVQAAKKFGFDEGFATGKSAVPTITPEQFAAMKKTAFEDGLKAGEAEFKTKMKALFA